MRVHLFTGPRARGDSRITLLRVVRPTWKFSLSLHPYWWRWERGLGRLRMTLCGLNCTSCAPMAGASTDAFAS